MDEREDTGVICATIQNNENEFGLKKKPKQVQPILKNGMGPT